MNDVLPPREPPALYLRANGFPAVRSPVVRSRTSSRTALAQAASRRRGCLPGADRIRRKSPAFRRRTDPEPLGRFARTQEFVAVAVAVPHGDVHEALTAQERARVRSLRLGGVVLHHLEEHVAGLEPIRSRPTTGMRLAEGGAKMVAPLRPYPRMPGSLTLPGLLECPNRGRADDPVPVPVVGDRGALLLRNVHAQ